MSDFREVIHSAITYGFYLDSCGEPERHYDWGAWIDLCGMSVEEAMSGLDDGSGGGSTTGKTKNTITFSMQKGANDEYSLNLKASYAPTQDVVLSFTMDGENRIVTLPAGTTTLDTGFKGEVPGKPYATITNTVISTEDEEYTYTSKNSVKTGVFTLTIVKDGVKTTEQVKYDTEVTLPAAEEKEGYDFVWKDSSGNVITGTTIEMPEANTTITGTYVAKEYILTYVVKEQVLNGSEITVQDKTTGTATVKFGEKFWNIIKNLTPSREGYTVSGWTSPDGTVNLNTKMPAHDLTVTNMYILNRYTLTYRAEGTVVSSTELYYGQDTVSEDVPAKTGYNAVGWDAEVPATMPARNITVNAVYEAIPYYIRYFVDNEEKYSEQHIYGDAISIRTDETKVGYTFSGWDTQLPATMPDNDIEVHGTFTINQYTLSFNASGTPYTSITADYGSTIPQIAEPSAVGYTFIEWDKEIPATMPASDMTFDAVFEINSHTLTYYVDGNEYSALTYNYGTQLTAIDEPVREGYTFSGWNGVPATMPDEDVDIYGTFSINSYLLTYYVDNEIVESAETEYNAEITPRVEQEREGYTFSGWDEVPERMPAHDVDIHGTFNINSHTLAYYVDGSIYSEESVEYGTALSAITAPEQVGYTFSGWTSLPATMPDSDVRVDGWFNVNQYTLSFFVEGEPYTSITADYGSAVPEITEPSREGHTFSGWDPSVPETVPASAMTFNGTFNINSWVATYFIDGMQYSSITYQYGAAIVYPDIPREGYVLTWTKNYLTMPDMNITIEGIYEEKQEPKTVYYGFVRSLDNKSVDTSSALDTFEYEDGAETNIQFIMDADDTGRYEYIENEGTEEELEEWMETEDQSYCVMAPSGVSVTLNDGIADIPLSVGATGDIDGDDYVAYYASIGTTKILTPQVYDMKITLTKN